MIPNHQKTNKRIDDILKTTDTFSDSWGIIDGTTDNPIEGITLKGYTLQAEGTPTMDNPIPIENLESEILHSTKWFKNVEPNQTGSDLISAEGIITSELIDIPKYCKEGDTFYLLFTNTRVMPKAASSTNWGRVSITFYDKDTFSGRRTRWISMYANSSDPRLYYYCVSDKWPDLTDCDKMRIWYEPEDITLNNSIFASSVSIITDRGIKSSMYSSTPSNIVNTGVSVSSIQSDANWLENLVVEYADQFKDSSQGWYFVDEQMTTANCTLTSDTQNLGYALRLMLCPGNIKNLPKSKFQLSVKVKLVSGDWDQAAVSIDLLESASDGSWNRNVSDKFKYELIDIDDTTKYLKAYGTFSSALYDYECKYIWTYLNCDTTDTTTSVTLQFSDINMCIIPEDEEFKYSAIESIPYKGKTILFPLQPGQKMYEGSMLTDKGIYHTRTQITIDGDTQIAAYNTMQAKLEYPFKYITVELPLGCKASANEISPSICNRLTATSYNAVSSTSYLQTEEALASLANTYWFLDHIGGVAVSVNMRLDNEYTQDNEADLKTRLTESPITIEYEVAEPYYEEYTEEQQEAWELIKQLRTYDEQTTIMSPATVEMNYVRDNGLSTIYETRKDAEQHHNGIYVVKDDITSNGRTIYYSDGRFVFHNQYSIATGVYTDSIQDTVSSTELNSDIYINKISVSLRQNPNNVPISYCASIVDSSTWKVDFTVIPQIIDGQGLIPDVGDGNNKIIADIEVEGYWKRDEIKFYVIDNDIEGIQTYTAPKGTTWYDWEGFASFTSDKITKDGYGVFYGEWDDHLLCYDKPDDGIAGVMSNELIIPNHTYYTEDLGIG